MFHGSPVFAEIRHSRGPWPWIYRRREGRRRAAQGTVLGVAVPDSPK